MQPKQDKNGFYYYEKLPPGTRIATADDFYDYNNQPIIDKPYLMQSYIHPYKFWANRIKKSFKLDKLQPWLSTARVFVFD